MRHAHLALIAIALLSAARAWATPPLATLLPETTKGFMSSPDVQLMQEKFDQTEPGKFTNDPIMKPFMDELRKQARDESNPDRIHYGVTWDDVKDVGRGEACIALIHTPPKRPVELMLVDVTGNGKAATAVLQKIFKRLTDQRVPWKQDTVQGEKVTIFNLPKNSKDPQRPVQVAYFIMKGVLGAVEDEGVARNIMGRLAGAKGDSLESIPGYVTVMKRCQGDAEMSKADEPQFRWYFNPLPYFEARRQLDPHFLKDGKMDLLRAYKNSGFEGVIAVGGYMHFSIKPYDVLNRVAIFAPPPYKKTLQGMQTPNAAAVEPPAWVPGKVATYLGGSLDLPVLMENIGPLYDYTIGDGDGAWTDTLNGIRDDKNGPQVDLEKRLFAKMGKRAIRITDVMEPVQTNSERRLIVGDLADAKESLAALEQFYKNDKTAKKKKAGNQEYWEIWPEEPQPGDIPAGVAVARNQLLYASQADMIKDYLRELNEDKQLTANADYRTVMEHVQAEAKNRSWSKLCLQGFMESREAYKSTYELTKQNKLPDSQALMGSLMNMLMGQDPSGKARKQQVDGSTLPPYAKVEHYFLPGGGLGVREDAKDFQGWFFIGFVLGKANGGVAARRGE